MFDLLFEKCFAEFVVDGYVINLFGLTFIQLLCITLKLCVSLGCFPLSDSSSFNPLRNVRMAKKSTT